MSRDKRNGHGGAWLSLPGGAHATLESVTPAKAGEMLRRNVHNRPVTEAAVAEYRAAMERGEYIFDGAPLRMDTDGSILDGQHRLLAIIESGTTQELIVVRGLAGETQATMDRGRRRSIADLFAMNGEVQPKTLAGATRALWAYQVTGEPHTLGARGYTPASTVQLQQVLKDHPGLRDSIAATAGEGLRAVIPGRSRLTVYHYLLSAVDAEDASAFFAKLATGENLAADDPIYVLRDRLLRERMTRAKTVALSTRLESAYVLRTWARWRAGETAAILRFTAGGARPDAYPVIEDCPIPVRGALAMGASFRRRRVGVAA